MLIYLCVSDGETVLDIPGGEGSGFPHDAHVRASARFSKPHIGQTPLAKMGLALPEHLPHPTHAYPQPISYLLLFDVQAGPGKSLQPGLRKRYAYMHLIVEKNCLPFFGHFLYKLIEGTNFEALGLAMVHACWLLAFG